MSAYDPPAPPAPAALVVVGTGELDVASAFREHYPFVLRALVGLGVPPIDADDVTQEVFVIAHRRRADFDPSRPARAWLYGIARGVARNRRRVRRPELVDALPAAADDPERDVANNEALALALRAMDGMSSKLREVFVLMEFEALSAPEVATLLEISVNTVYSRLRLARDRFDAAVAKLRAREGRV